MLKEVKLKFLPKAPKPKKAVKFPVAETELGDIRKRLAILEEKMEVIKNDIIK